MAAHCVMASPDASFLTGGKRSLTRKGHALTAFSLLLLVSVADLWVTFHFNPSLSAEANPLVATLGLDRFGLIASNASIVAVLGMGLLFYQRGPHIVPALAVSDYWEYAGLTLYGRRMTRTELWRAFLLCWPLPSNWHQFFRFAAYFCAWSIIAARISAVFTWFAIYGQDWTWYIALREVTAIAGYPCLELLVGLLTGTLMLRVLFRSEYLLDQDTRLAAR